MQHHYGAVAPYGVGGAMFPMAPMAMPSLPDIPFSYQHHPNLNTFPHVHHHQPSPMNGFGQAPPPPFQTTHAAARRNDDDNASLYTNLCVSKVPSYMSDDGLECAFMALFPGRLSGDVVVSAKVMRDVATGASKGYGFVLFRHPPDADFVKHNPPVVSSVDVMKQVRRGERRGLALSPRDVADGAGVVQLVVQVARHSGHNVGGASSEQASVRRVYIGNIPFYVSPKKIELFFSAIAHQMSTSRPGIDPTIVSTSVRTEEESSEPKVGRGPLRRHRGLQKGDATVKESYQSYFANLWNTSRHFGLSPGQGNWLENETTAFVRQRGLRPDSLDSVRYHLPLADGSVRASNGTPMPPHFMMFMEFKDHRVAQDIIIKVHGKQPFPLGDAARDVLSQKSFRTRSDSSLVNHLSEKFGLYPLQEFPDTPDGGRLILVPRLSEWLRIPTFLKFRSTTSAASLLLPQYDESSSDDESGQQRALQKRLAVPPLFVKAAENKERRDERVKINVNANTSSRVDAEVPQALAAPQAPSQAAPVVSTPAPNPEATPLASTLAPLPAPSLPRSALATLQVGSDVLKAVRAHNERFATSSQINGSAPGSVDVGASTVVSTDTVPLQIISTVVDETASTTQGAHHMAEHSVQKGSECGVGMRAGSFGTPNSGNILISMLTRKSMQVVVEYSSATGKQCYFFQCAESKDRVFIGSVESPVSVFIAFDRNESIARRQIMSEELAFRESSVRQFAPLLGPRFTESHISKLLNVEAAACNLPNEFNGATTAFGGEIVRTQQNDLTQCDQSSKGSAATADAHGKLAAAHPPISSALPTHCVQHIVSNVPLQPGLPPVVPMVPGPLFPSLPVMVPFTHQLHPANYPHGVHSYSMSPNPGHSSDADALQSILQHHHMYSGQFGGAPHAPHGVPHMGAQLPQMQPILQSGGFGPGSGSGTTCASSLSSALAQAPNSPGANAIGSKSAADLYAAGPLASHRAKAQFVDPQQSAATCNSLAAGFSTIPQGLDSGEFQRRLVDSVQWSGNADAVMPLRSMPDSNFPNFSHQ